MQRTSKKHIIFDKQTETSWHFLCIIFSRSYSLLLTVDKNLTNHDGMWILIIKKILYSPELSHLMNQPSQRNAYESVVFPANNNIKNRFPLKIFFGVNWERMENVIDSWRFITYRKMITHIKQHITFQINILKNAFLRSRSVYFSACLLFFHD